METPQQTSSKGVSCLVQAALLALPIAGWMTYKKVWGGHLWQSQRVPELQAVVADAAPIITALNAYTRDHKGEAPTTLTKLVPDYLKALPVAGPVSRKGEWLYKLAVRNPEQGKWQLGVQVRKDFCSRCDFSFGDTFVYHASGKYPREGYGGILEPVAGWGYYHE
jgi:hypothetical protein